MRLYIYDDKNEAGKWSAEYVCNRIREFEPTAEKPFVLGLPTGEPFKGYLLCWMEMERRGRTRGTQAISKQEGEERREKNKRTSHALSLSHLYNIHNDLYIGSTPLPTYKELIRLHKEDGLSFKHVVTFNMDEYVR
jgi:6-phosphogluconolactonase/glucosamine-6-phosphate isomerase/deaminase